VPGTHRFVRLQPLLQAEPGDADPDPATRGAVVRAMGGDYCSQGGSCPDGYSSLERSVDYNPCCVTQAGTW